MSCAGIAKDFDLPEDLLAVSFEDSRGLVGSKCLEAGEYQKETEQTATPIFEGDEWFDGSICARCGFFVEREGE